MLLPILAAIAVLPFLFAWVVIALTERESAQLACSDGAGRPPSFIQTILVYALLGPVVGTLPWLLVGLTAMLKDSAGPLLMFVIVGYVFGFVPAALTGLAQAWLGRFYRQRTGTWLTRLASAGLGLLLGGGLTWLTSLAFGKGYGSLWFSVHGMLAGAILGALFPVLGRPEANT